MMLHYFIKLKREMRKKEMIKTRTVIISTSGLMTAHPFDVYITTRNEATSNRTTSNGATSNGNTSYRTTSYRTISYKITSYKTSSYRTTSIRAPLHLILAAILSYYINLILHNFD